MTVHVQQSKKPANYLNVILTVGIVAVVLAAVIVTNAFGAAKDAPESLIARVCDADGETYELPLSVDTTLEVASSAGTNVIEVSNGSVCVSEADCPNLDCVHQGKVSQAGQQIICLPHKLVVTVADCATGEGSASAYDVMGS